MQSYDDLLNRLNNTKPVNNRDPFITAGTHDLIVSEVSVFKDQKWGDSVRVTFEVERSTNPNSQPGSSLCKLFNLFKPAKFETQSNDADEFVNFVCILQGIQPGEHAQSMRALIKRHADGGALESQPVRGARIKAFGAEVGKVNERGQRYVKVSWQNVAQDQATVGRTRAELDARRPLTGTTVANVPVHPAPVAPQQYAQPAPVAPVVQPAYGMPAGYPAQTPMQVYQQIPTGHATAVPQGYAQPVPQPAPGPFSGFFGKPPGQ